MTQIPQLLNDLYGINESNIEYNLTLEILFDFPIIKQSIAECKVGKMWKDSAIYNSFYEDYLTYEINREILSGTYKLDELFHTVIWERGKERLICSLTFKDRVIQKILNQGYILVTFRKRLIYDNMASLENRGIHAALNRLEIMLHKIYCLYGYNFYIAKCDIKSYFDNIPHQYIFDKLDKYTSDKRIVKIIFDILQQFKYDPCIHNGEQVDFGIGLGGEVPQSFGLLCLDELDHIMKENNNLKCNYYIRYMDDIIFLDNDWSRINYKMNWVSNYLNNIDLILNIKKSSITPASNGIKFLKIHFFLNNNGKVIRKPTKDNYKHERRKLKSLQNKYINGELTLKNIVDSYQSWKGYAKTVADAYLEISIMDQLYNELFNNENAIINRIVNMHL